MEIEYLYIGRFSILKLKLLVFFMLNYEFSIILIKFLTRMFVYFLSGC